MSKRKFSIRQVLAAFKTNPGNLKRDIHSQLAETIAERKRILIHWEQIFHPQTVVINKDIHNQLAETIAELKKTRQQLKGRVSQESGFIRKNKRAA